MEEIRKTRVFELYKNLIQHHNYMLSLEEIYTYSACQEAAILFGNYLEMAGKKHEKIVSLLEEYCEYIYQLSNLMIEKQRIDILGKVHFNLEKLEEEITKSVFSNKKLIVFLPYMVSMWDSMESIWKAAMLDENCIVKVIPIPYFDKKADGTLGVLHDESNDYPEYVPIVSYQEYDLLLNKPDILYIHNPYDNGNYSTTIHPEYYTRELKKNVGILVYIPYFVVPFNNIKPHLCVLPGTIFSDYVIVQSEEVKEVYLNELRQFENENNCVGRFGNLSNKILALGSPKYDKVLLSEISDFKIPEEWEAIISKKSSNNSKIILYNTSITSMLENGWDMICKIERVLRLFKGKKNIILLWRPHPLLPMVLQSIKPEFMERYNKIVHDFRKDAWGIYDESNNLNRAIAISDAYYGDGGSLLELYRMTGKPLMLCDPKFSRRNSEGEKDGADMV